MEPAGPPLSPTQLDQRLAREPSGDAEASTPAESVSPDQEAGVRVPEHVEGREPSVASPGTEGLQGGGQATIYPPRKIPHARWCKAHCLEQAQLALIQLINRKLHEDDDYDEFHSIYPNYVSGKLVIVLIRMSARLLEKVAQALPHHRELFQYQVMFETGDLSNRGPPFPDLHTTTALAHAGRSTATEEFREHSDETPDWDPERVLTQRKDLEIDHPVKYVMEKVYDDEDFYSLCSIYTQGELRRMTFTLSLLNLCLRGRYSEQLTSHWKCDTSGW